MIFNLTIYICHSTMFAFLDSNKSKGLVEPYLHDLQLYKYYPGGNIPLIELETICLHRAQVLLYIEKIHKEFGFKETTSQCKTRLIDILKENGYTLFAQIINGVSKEFGSDAEVTDKILELRRQDHISHYMLLAIFALQDKRGWFYTQELRLFSWRLYTLTIEEMKEFLRVNKLKTFDISKKERKDLEIYIKESNLSHEMNFYKVPFLLIMDLVARRAVFLRYGMAFVPENEFMGICMGYFRENLNVGLASIPLVAAEAASDIRIKQIFDKVIKYIKLQKSAAQELYAPSLGEFDEVSKISYPLCMKIIHEKLRKHHHLVYGERLQYSLFLRSIGVTLDDALELWKQEFIKGVDVIKFEKEYGYRLRHIYGEEGACKEYKCYNCMKILYSDVKQTESHGCPFKHLKYSLLRQKLSDYKLVPTDIEDIVRLSSLGCYQKACKRYYESTHNCSVDMIFDSPVDYFNESRKTKIAIINS